MHYMSNLPKPSKLNGSPRRLATIFSRLTRPALVGAAERCGSDYDPSELRLE